MFYIALAFLVGILWLHYKILASLLFLFVILSIYRKKCHWFMYIIVMILPILSFLFFEQQLIHTIQKRSALLQQSNINQHGIFQKIYQINNNTVTGFIKINNKSYRFYYYTNASINIKGINNHSCYVSGSYKAVSSSVHRPLIVTLKHIDINNCDPQKISLNSFFLHHKQHLYYKIQQSGLHQYDKVIAVLFGDVSLIPKQLLENVKDTGIYHLMAVSGSHIIAIVAMVYFSCIRIGLPLPFIKTFICIILPIYGCYTDFAPSALRAIITVITVIILPQRMLCRATDVLGSTFVITSLINPQFVYDIGFQFSFMITLFILLSAPILTHHYQIVALIYLNIVTFLGGFMINSLHFNQIQWIGLFSNLIFIPLYTFIYFPLAIFYLLYVHSPITFKFITTCVDTLYIVHDKLVYFFSMMNRFHWYIPELSEIQMTCFFVMIFFILRYVVLKKFKHAIILFLLFAITITYLTKDNNVQFTMFDVGHGDALLLKTAKNHTIMIDTGGKVVDNNMHYNGSISKYHILPTFRKKGINKVDYLIITHPHSDHMGELEFICQTVSFKNIIINKQSFSAHQLNYILDIAQTYKINILDFHTFKHISLDQVYIDLLDATLPNSKDLNEHSIIALIKYRKYKLLLMGDATLNNEQVLLKKYDVSNIDILKIGHHGSKTSSSESFLKITNPRISLISNGHNNKFRLPNVKVINNLKAIQSSIYETAYHGQVTINLDKELVISTEK